MHQSTQPHAAGNRSRAIDMLRGLAVLLVMIAHLPFSQAGLDGGEGAAYPPPWLAGVMVHGHYGVQLFLVISGYCIHTRWARKGALGTTVPFVPFWKRRLTRLYPPYLVALFGPLVLVLVGNAASHVAVDRVQLAIDLGLLLLLAQNLNDASAHVGNPPLWSLALEEQLYLLYFPLLAVRRKRGWPTAIALVFAGNFLWLGAGYFIKTTWVGAWMRLGPPIGCRGPWVRLRPSLTGELRSCRGGPARFSFSSCWGGAGMLLSPPLQAFVVTCSFFVLVHWAAEASGLLGGWSWARPLVSLGEISYGVYLVHNVAFIVSKRVMVSAGIPPLAILGLRFTAGLLAGYALYRIVEVPSLRRAQQIRVPLVESGGMEPLSPVEPRKRRANSG